jgi:hypothetical protein
MNTIDITEPYCIKKARELYETGLLKDHLDCKNYLNQYFFSACDGTVFMKMLEPYKFYNKIVMHHEWSILRKEDLKDKLGKIIAVKEGSKSCDSTLFTWFMNQPIERRMGMDIMKPFIFTENGIEYLNLAKPFLYKKKIYADFSDNIKSKLQIFLDYIKEVLASSNEEQYNYLMKWLANMIQGNKNDALIYLKGPQGIGKSTLTDFLCEYVLGWDISLISGSEPLKSPFNKCLMGKLLVVFEELETFSDKDWEGISATIKRNTTAKKSNYSDKFEKVIVADDINNYIINTNTEALKDSDGRRIYICDVSTKRMQDYEYFGKIKNNCFNHEVGEAFFSLLSEIDVKDFRPQQYPITEAKEMAFSERLDFEYKFLKYEYVLQNKSIIKKKGVVLFSEYTEYCESIKRRALSLKMFYKKLRDINLETYKTNGEWCYDVSIDTLKEIAKKGKWIDKYDEEVKSESSHEASANEQLVKENAELKKEIERLNKLLNEKNNIIEEPIIEEIKPTKIKKSKKVVEPIIEEEIIEKVEEVIEPTKKIIKKKTIEKKETEYEFDGDEINALVKFYEYMDGKINKSEIYKYDTQFLTILQQFPHVDRDVSLVDKIHVYFNNDGLKERVFKAFDKYVKEKKTIIEEPKKEIVKASKTQMKKQGNIKLSEEKKDSKLNKLFHDSDKYVSFDTLEF